MAHYDSVEHKKEIRVLVTGTQHRLNFSTLMILH